MLFHTYAPYSAKRSDLIEVNALVDLDPKLVLEFMATTPILFAPKWHSCVVLGKNQLLLDYFIRVPKPYGSYLIGPDRNKYDRDSGLCIRAADLWQAYP